MGAGSHTRAAVVAQFDGGFARSGIVLPRLGRERTAAVTVSVTESSGLPGTAGSSQKPGPPSPTLLCSVLVMDTILPVRPREIAMEDVLATTKMSSKGQVVIPEAARRQMGLAPGAQFVVLWHDDVVMLKVISPPSRKEIGGLLKSLERKARAAGRTRGDIPKAKAEARRKK